MKRTFKTVDYDQALDLTVRLGDCLPSDHLARFVVDSVALLDLSALYARYGPRGGEPYAPEVLLGLLLWSMLPTIRPQTQLFVPFLLRSLRQAARSRQLTQMRRSRERRSKRLYQFGKRRKLATTTAKMRARMLSMTR